MRDLLIEYLEDGGRRPIDIAALLSRQGDSSFIALLSEAAYDERSVSRIRLANILFAREGINYPVAKKLSAIDGAGLYQLIAPVVNDTVAEVPPDMIEGIVHWLCTVHESGFYELLVALVSDERPSVRDNLIRAFAVEKEGKYPLLDLLIFVDAQNESQAGIYTLVASIVVEAFKGWGFPVLCNFLQERYDTTGFYLKEARGYCELLYGVDDCKVRDLVAELLDSVEHFGSEPHEWPPFDLNIPGVMSTDYLQPAAY